MATRSTRDQVQDMTEQGLSPRQIATLTGVSTQRVYQILNDLKKEGVLDDRS